MYDASIRVLGAAYQNIAELRISRKNLILFLI